MERKDDGRTLSELTRTWTREQAELQQRVISHDDVPWCLPGSNSSASEQPRDAMPLQRIGGLDVSFFSSNDAATGAAETSSRDEGNADQSASERGVAALVVLSFPELEVIYEDCREVDLGIPYISGFLGFRECPAFLALLEPLRGTDLEPQVLLVDGFGTLHARGCGSASHLGVVSGVPTVGVGKTLVCIDGLSERSERERCTRELSRMSSEADHGGGAASGQGRDDLCLPMVGVETGEVRGMSLYKAGTSRPIFVSVGHRLSLETATKLVLACSKHKVPEPIRQADLRSREFVRQREQLQPGPVVAPPQR